MFVCDQQGIFIVNSSDTMVGLWWDTYVFNKDLRWCGWTKRTTRTYKAGNRGVLKSIYSPIRWTVENPFTFLFISSHTHSHSPTLMNKKNIILRLKNITFVVSELLVTRRGFSEIYCVRMFYKCQYLCYLFHGLWWCFCGLGSFSNPYYLLSLTSSSSQEFWMLYYWTLLLFFLFVLVWCA